MESFCHGRLLYSPLFVDLSPDCVITTLSHPLQLVIFPAVALCDPKLLEGELVRNMRDDDSTIELEPDMDALLSLFTGVECISDVAAVLSDSEGEGGEGGGMTLAKNWRMLLLSLSLALASLQDCQMKSLSSLVHVRHSLPPLSLFLPCSCPSPPSPLSLSFLHLPIPSLSLPLHPSPPLSLPTPPHLPPLSPSPLSLPPPSHPLSLSPHPSPLLSLPTHPPPLHPSPFN